MLWRYFFEVFYSISCLIPFKGMRLWVQRNKLFDYKAKLNALRKTFPKEDWRHFKLAKGGGSLAFITKSGHVFKIRKFHLTDDSIAKFTQEKRITDAVAGVLNIKIPKIEIHQAGIYTVYVTEFIPGRVLVTMPLGKICEHRTELANQLADIIYTLFNAKFPELDDLRPQNAPASDTGITHGDMCSNIIVDPKTMRIVGIIDWEYARFSSLRREFFGLFRVRKKMRLTDIAPEVMWKYFAKKLGTAK